MLLVPGLLAATLAGQALRADALWLANPQREAPNRIPLQAQAFDLRAVRLRDWPYLRAQELDRQYLLSLDPVRLLHMFRLNAGLPSPAQPLGGWEEPACEVRGHFTGHFLSACALMYASTGDKRLKDKGDTVVAGLAECQAKLGRGYLSAYPEEFIDRVERQQRVWAPYYTLHKLLAGLLDMYVYGENARALLVARRFGDWAIERNARLSDEQMQKMLGNEHGGMNEALANLHGLTGDARYLAIARRFNDAALIDPFSRRVDNLTGKHANTQIPKFIGVAREYELTGDESLKTAATFFWDTVVKERSYVIGGHSDGEMFTPKERLSTALGPNTTETCNTYNMLKLTRHLFCWEPRVEYADYYERALLNHILASQDPETGMMCYYVPLRSGSHKTYNTPLDSFWCCTGTGVENHAKYGDSIYFHDGRDTLYVNQFIASELHWAAKGLTLTQETRFPQTATTTLAFASERPLKLTVRLRRPAWAAERFEVRVNGRRQSPGAPPGSWVTLSRTWKRGDRVAVSLPFGLRWEGFRDNPDRFALLHGPVVLAAPVAPRKPLPALVADRRGAFLGLQPLPGKPSHFIVPASLLRAPDEEPPPDVTLEPFFALHGQRRYQVYWDAFTPAQWETKKAEYRAERQRQRELAARTIDAVNPGEEQNERAHNVRGERSASGNFNERAWRHATDGGWFAWDLKVQPERAQSLQVTYWGSDGGNRLFDLLLDGHKLATQRLQDNQPGRFYEETYPLPPDLLRGKTNITVRFQAHPGAFAGGVFGVRVLRTEP